MKSKGIRQALGALAQRHNESLDIQEISVQVPGLTKSLVGTRICLVADLHMPQLLPYHYHIYNAIRDARPDAIFIAGDTVDENTRSIPALVPFFLHLSRIAPSIAILGNNDCSREYTHQLRAMYLETGVTLLENETRMLILRGGATRVTGLTDPFAFTLGVHRDPVVENPERVSMREALQPGYDDHAAHIPTLLLMHQPQMAQRYAELRPSVIFAGHAHGGQIRLPLVGGLFAPGQGIFPRYTSGLYATDGSQMVVSRGLGNHHFPLRLWNRPHIPIAILS